MKLPPNATAHQRAHHFLQTTLMPRYKGIKSYQPLQVGAYEAIRVLHPKVQPQVLRDALFLHCTSFKYLSVLKRAKVRVDLHGEPAGEVTADQHRRAREKLRTLDRARKRVTDDGPQPSQPVLVSPRAGVRPGSPAIPGWASGTSFPPPTVMIKKRRAVMA